MKKMISAMLSLLILLSAISLIFVSADESAAPEVLFALSNISANPSETVQITKPDGAAFPDTTDASVSVKDGKLLLKADTTQTGNFTLFSLPDKKINAETYTLVMKAVIVSANETKFSEFDTNKPVAEVGFRVAGAAWEYGWDNGTSVRFLRRSDGKIGAQGLNRNDITKASNKDRNSAQAALAAGTAFDDTDTRSVLLTAAVAVGKTEVGFFLNGEKFWSVDLNSYAAGGYPFIGVFKNTILEVEEWSVVAGTEGYLEESSPEGPSTPDEPEEPLNTDPTYYPNGTVILNEEILKKNLDKIKLYGMNGSRISSASVAWNNETGRLQLTADTSVSTHFLFTSVPAGLDYFTMTADLYITRNDYGNNVLIQMGYRNPDNAWGHGNLIQFYLYNDGKTKDKAQMVDKGPDGSTVSTAMTFDQSLIGADGTGKVTLKIVVDDKIANYYINDTFIHAMKVSKMQLAYGVPFIVCRSNVTLEADNLMIWSGVGDPSETMTIENTEPCAAKDIPTVETTEPVVTDTPVTTAETPSQTTEPVTTIKAPETATETETPSAVKSGCSSAVGASFVVLLLMACVPTVACGKRKH